MKKQKVAQTVFLPARDCPHVRTAIETLVSGILNDGKKQSRRKDVNIHANEVILDIFFHFLKIMCCVHLFAFSDWFR